MAAPHTHEITALLRAWTAGDEQALEKLTPLVYSELLRRAHRYMTREPPGHILQTTALINEVYLRVVDLRGCVNLRFAQVENQESLKRQACALDSFSTSRRRKICATTFNSSRGPEERGPRYHHQGSGSKWHYGDW